MLLSVYVRGASSWMLFAADAVKLLRHTYGVGWGVGYGFWLTQSAVEKQENVRLLYPDFTAVETKVTPTSTVQVEPVN